MVLGTENIGQNGINCFVCAGEVGRRKCHLSRLSVVCEENPDLGLWRSDDYERLCVSEDIGRGIREVRESFLIEFVIQKPSSMHSFNPFTQFRNMLD